MRNNQREATRSKRATTIFPDHTTYIAGLFQDEQVKDARQKDKHPFLLLFYTGHQRRAGNNLPI